ncbi:MAG TPA: protein rep [Methylophilaceae bacterium]|jgi:hypothetical protein
MTNESPSLGISAKSLHAVNGLKRKQSATGDKLKGKELRYSLHRTASGLLYDRDAMKQHRTCSCSRNVVSDGVEVYRAVDGSDARFSNIITCGSAWACPICSSKITEGRREELQRAIGIISQSGGGIALLTLTFSHSITDNLGDNLENYTAAVTKFKNSRTYKRMMAAYGIQYTRRHGDKILEVKGAAVRSMEVTYGVNGWHPHTHDLLFLRTKKDELLNDHRLIEELKHEWLKQCLKAGLGDNSKINDMLANGLDIRGGDYAAEYVAKFGREPKLEATWGAAQEVTKGISKIGGGEHATPFQLLAWAQGGDQKAGLLFKEYVNLFEGKRQLVWSAGLKKILGVDEIDDETIAQNDAVMPDEENVMRLDVEQWQFIISRNARGEFLRVVAAGGRDAAIAFIYDVLAPRPPTHTGYFNTFSRPNPANFY